MKRNSAYIKGAFIAVALCLGLFAGFGENNAHAFSNQVIQKGATGEDVVELQSRLQYLGFYTGNIDGVFGWRTYWALRNFQYEFGMKIDGLAGTKTKQKLVKASKYDKAWVNKQIDKGKKFSYYGGVPKSKQGGAKSGVAKGGVKGAQKGAPKGTAQGKGKAGGEKAAVKPAQVKPAKNIPDGYSQNDINLMSNAVYGEARGEPYIGQVAVAAVIINRVENSAFPNTVSGVIFEPGAFTAVADGQIYLTPNKQAKKAVMDALNGWDPTGEAIYYFNPDTATSSWIWGRPQIKKIGKHIFCN
ncbi:spore cortex-lytic enzyme [Fictibacillus phosphorivorans]|uniref:spore cortex-lytic enzyme n=1 Tax=Fictibacillus phosphorivorans TaxID=1221500 RepID=UPI00203D84FE|nr:spore cortex-lytic enzyme [Fictibacillus phosphorivorans]MCM3718955.1 spore cortex-lytic enzyme [Fictibacillus phosphorivorans]MCM3776577.1 spore cortex-lytic enzyme [Fictibacillus phosphorivorans]